MIYEGGAQDCSITEAKCQEHRQEHAVEQEQWAIIEHLEWSADKLLKMSIFL